MTETTATNTPTNEAPVRKRKERSDKGKKRGPRKPKPEATGSIENPTNL